MYFYFSIYLLLSVFSTLKLAGSLRTIVYLLLFVSLSLFVGTRLDTGCDFESYMQRFSQLPSDYASLAEITEPGYFLFTYLIKAAGLHFVWVNVLAAFLFFFFLLKFCNSHPRPLLLLAVSFPILVIQLSMSGVRQALAVAFLMGAFVAFFQGKRLWIVAYVLLASSFHQSAIIMLPLALMVGRQYSTARVISALVVLIPVAAYFAGDNFDVYQDRYIAQIYGEMTSEGAVFRLGLVVLTALAFELFGKPLARTYPYQYNLMRVFALASFALVPVMLLNTVIVHRLIFYITPVQLYTLCLLPAAMFTSPKNSRYAELAIIALYGTYLLVWFSLSRHANNCYVPYSSYLM
ncbi:MAG: EpsG family protein [Pseudomonadota bacterium]